MQRRTRIELDAPAADVEQALAAVRADGSADGTREFSATVTAAGTRSILEIEVANDQRVPYFHWFFAPVIRRAVGKQLAYVVAATRAHLTGEPVPDPPKLPFLLGQGNFDDEAVRLLAVAGAIGALASFGAALFGQNANSVADSFGASNADLGTSLAVTRVGVLVALLTTALADRQGRRKLLAISFAGVCIFNAVTAIAPNLIVFTGAQLLVRAFVNSTIVVAGIAVIEEAPENARAFAATTFALASGAGYALSVLLLPLADLGPDAWRIAFALSGMTLLFLPRLLRRLPETRRYAAIAATNAERGRFREVIDRSYGPRFALLAAAAFLASVFSAPSAQLTNRFLTDERGFSNSGISVLRGVTNGLPGLLGLVIGGRLAEQRGRRPVAAIGLGLSSVAQIVFFLVGGPSLWIASTVAILFAGAATVALGTLDAELFPTEVRGTGNALLLVCGVAGSVVGLLLAGYLADTVGGLGPAIALCGIAPLIAAFFIVPRLPEAAHRKLDDVSPSEM
ncbi:MAG: MFS transporter [Acidimicrobiia bacterium]